MERGDWEARNSAMWQLNPDVSEWRDLEGDEGGMGSEQGHMLLSLAPGRNSTE